MKVNWNFTSFLFWVLELNAISCCKHFEFLESNLVLVSEVPFNEIFELSLFKFESTSLNQVFEIIDVDNIWFLMLYSVEESIQEHVVLLLIWKLIFVLNLERLHQLTELILVELWVTIRIAHHDLFQRG